MTSRPDLPLRFTPREFIGSLGDLGTLLTLMTALIVFNGLAAVPTIALVGATYIATGLYYRLPVPVQPLKAAAMIAIATGASIGEIRAAAFWMAAIMLLLSVTKAVDRLSELFPPLLIKGIQLGIGLMMIRTGARLFVSWPGDLSRVVHGTHSTAIGTAGLLPTGAEFWTALVVLVLPQLPLTLGNSVLATRDCALKYFGASGEHVTAGRLAATVGLGNLAAGLFGGMPMCHGAGGMTAHYHTGARTGGAAVMLGVLLICVAVVGGNSAASMLSATPAWALGVLLGYVGLRHCLLARDAFRGPATAAAVTSMGIAACVSGNFVLVLALGLAIKAVAVDIPAWVRRRSLINATVAGNDEL